MKKKRKVKKNFPLNYIWYFLIFVGIIYLGWILFSLADVSGNPFGVNNGRIENYLNVIEKIGNNSEQLVELYTSGVDYEFVRELIEDDFERLNEYEQKLNKYGISDREDVVLKLKISRLQLETAKSQIINQYSL